MAKRLSERQRWEQLGDYLHRDRLHLLSPDSQATIVAEWTEVTRLEALLDDALLIGLVGGTGVGKSTFINALAGERVSHSGDRRPTTDRVVVYRYVDTTLPSELPVRDLAQPQVQHRHEGLSKVVLFDFPDFDSAERAHADILQRYLPHLDILLIVVDDMKYADRRLYELLSQLDHSAANLFVIFNKIDRLRTRYGPKCETVVSDLNSDIRQKMLDYAAISLPSRQVFPISAGEVLESRLAGHPLAANAPFRAVEDLLAGFQEEKRRRRAKEKNIDARQHAVMKSVEQAALNEENRGVLEEARGLLERWQRELSSAIDAISEDVVLERDRRALQRARLRRKAPHWGFPFSLGFTLLAQRPWGKGDPALTDTQELAGRLLHHYRGFFEAADNLRERFRTEFLGTEMDAEGDSQEPSPEAWAATSAAQMRTHWADEESKTPYWTRGLVHLPAVGFLAVALWSCVQPAFEGGGGWVKAIGLGFLAALNPTFVIGLVVLVLVAYAVVGGILWLREVQRLDQQIGDAEREVRQAVVARRDQLLGGLRENLTAVAQEFEFVKTLLDR